MPIESQWIYTIRFPMDTEAKAIAMNVDTNRKEFGGICYLTPGERGHMIEGKLDGQTEDGFIFVSEGYEPGEWEFKRLTYDALKNGFYKHIYGGEQLLKQVSNTEELEAYYHDNF